MAKNKQRKWMKTSILSRMNMLLSNSHVITKEKSGLSVTCLKKETQFNAINPERLEPKTFFGVFIICALLFSKVVA